MIQSAYFFVIIVGSIITSNVAEEIFQPPSESTVFQIKGTSTPWVIPDLIPTIEEFKDNVFEDLKVSPAVQKIWNMKTECYETRDIFFNIINQFLYDLGHPVPAALANIVSKSGSLFKPLNMTVYFESDATHLAEFFLSKNVEIERETATKYVDSISDALEGVNTNDKDAVWQAILDGYNKYVASYGFDLKDVADELMELFSSQLIILHDK